MNLLELAKTMREFSTSSGDHHMLAAATLEHLHKTQNEKEGTLTGNIRLRSFITGLFFKEVKLVLQVEYHKGIYLSSGATIGTELHWRDATVSDLEYIKEILR